MTIDLTDLSDDFADTCVWHHSSHINYRKSRKEPLLPNLQSSNVIAGISVQLHSCD